MNERARARRWASRVGLVATLPSLWALQAYGAGPPAKLTLSPMTAELAAGQTAPFTARLLDAAGGETVAEANSQVGFAVDVSGVASVSIDMSNPLVGNVMARRPGMTAVRAFYVRDGQQTNIFAAADLTVTAGSDGGVVTEHDAGSAQDAAVDGPAPGCSGSMCGNSCTNTNQDPANCGSCGHACMGGQFCVAGLCNSNCGVLALCAGICTGLNDRTNCGTCGHPCAAGEECKSGTTCTACAAGSALCGERCTDLRADRTNCGSCAHVCPGSEDACVNAVCVADPNHQHHSSCSLGGGPEGTGTRPPLSLALFLAAVAALATAVRRRHRG
jgi:hypothetical protein